MASSPSPLRIAFAGFIAMAAVMGIGRFVYTPILPYMADVVPLSENQAGLIAASNFLGYLIGSLLAGTGLLSGNRRSWVLWALAFSVRQRAPWR
jgi:predicted MFS family arabinose efflux permease